MQQTRVTDDRAVAVIAEHAAQRAHRKIRRIKAPTGRHLGEERQEPARTRSRDGDRYRHG